MNIVFFGMSNSAMRTNILYVCDRIHASHAQGSDNSLSIDQATFLLTSLATYLFLGGCHTKSHGLINVEGWPIPSLDGRTSKSSM